MKTLKLTLAGMIAAAAMAYATQHEAEAGSYGKRVAKIYTVTLYWKHRSGRSYTTSAFPSAKYQAINGRWVYRGYDDAGLRSHIPRMRAQGWQLVNYRARFWRWGRW